MPGTASIFFILFYGAMVLLVPFLKKNSPYPFSVRIFKNGLRLFNKVYYITRSFCIAYDNILFLAVFIKPLRPRRKCSQLAYPLHNNCLSVYERN